MSDKNEDGPSPKDELRDRIFRARLELEQLRRGGNIAQLEKAGDNLRGLLRSQTAQEAKGFKRRQK
jgi:hypothetical protein